MISLKTTKKTLKVETWLTRPVNIELDVIKEIGNKILIKTFKGLTELTLNEKENYWFVTNEFKSNCIPEEWRNFIICPE